MGDSPSTVEVTKEIAVAFKETSRSVKKRIGQRSPPKRVPSGPRHGSLRILVWSRLKNVPHLCSVNERGLGPRKRVLAKGVSARQIRVRLDCLRFFDALFSDL